MVGGVVIRYPGTDDPESTINEMHFFHLYLSKWVSVVKNNLRFMLKKANLNISPV